MPTSRLVIKITHGTQGDSLERLAQALAVAATGVASGLEVSVWLTGGATLVAQRGAELPSLAHSSPLAELVATILEGGTLTVCTQCAKRREITEADLLDGVRIAGSATFLEEAISEDTRALVY